MTSLLGALYGFVVSVPPTGPVAVLVLERALQRAYGPALALALGSTIADLPYIVLAALGYARLVEGSPGLGVALDLVSALLLLAIALRLVWSSPASTPRSSSKGAVLTGLLLGLANPTRLLTWALVASLVRPEELVGYTLAVEAGQLSWWGTLLWGLQRAGGNLSDRTRTWLMSGVAIAAVGLALGLVLRACRHQM